jgi:hypothetical protein
MNKRTKKILTVSLDKDILEETERLRGLVKRSSYVNSLLSAVAALS